MRKILDVFVVILCIMIGMSIYNVYSGKSKVVSLFGYSGLSVVSGSMEPEISIGDYIIVKKPKIEDINTRSIITYEKEDVLITHRVVRINDDGSYVTKGDANNVEDDGDVKFENIIGVCAFNIPLLGTILLFIKSNIYYIIGFLILVSISIKFFNKVR